MKKSEKRRIGEARQAEYLEQTRQQGLKAQEQAQKIAEKRKLTKAKIEERQKAAEAMKKLGENAQKSAVIFNGINQIMVEDDSPEVLNMTDRVHSA